MSMTHGMKNHAKSIIAFPKTLTTSFVNHSNLFVMLLIRHALSSVETTFCFCKLWMFAKYENIKMPLKPICSAIVSSVELNFSHRLHYYEDNSKNLQSKTYFSVSSKLCSAWMLKVHWNIEKGWWHVKSWKNYLQSFHEKSRWMWKGWKNF